MYIRLYTQTQNVQISFKHISTALTINLFASQPRRHVTVSATVTSSTTPTRRRAGVTAGARALQLFSESLRARDWLLLLWRYLLVAGFAEVDLWALR